jgi:hypothetical protein
MSRHTILTDEVIAELREIVSVSREILLKHLVGERTDPDFVATQTARVAAWEVEERFVLDHADEWAFYFDAIERAARCGTYAAPIYYLEQLEAFVSGDLSTPEAQQRLRLLRHIVLNEYECNVVRYGTRARLESRKAGWRFETGAKLTGRQARGHRFVESYERSLLGADGFPPGKSTESMWHFRKFVTNTLPPTAEEGYKAYAAECLTSH